MCILRYCSHRRSNQETRQTIYQWTVYYLRHNEEKVKIFWNFFGSIKKVCSSTDDFDGNTVQYWIISLGLSNDRSITTHSRVQPNCVCKDCLKQNPSFTNGWTLQRPKRKRKRPKVSIAVLSLLKLWIYTGNTKHVKRNYCQRSRKQKITILHDIILCSQNTVPVNLLDFLVLPQVQGFLWIAYGVGEEVTSQML